MEEQKSVRSFHLRLPYDIFMKLKVYCAKNDCTIGDFFTTALKNELKKRGAE